MTTPIFKPVISSDLIYQSLIENLADGLLISGTDGIIQICSKSFAQLVGSSCDKLIGQPLEELVRLEHTEAVCGTAGGAQPVEVLSSDNGKKTDHEQDHGLFSNVKTSLALITTRPGLHTHMPAAQFSIVSEGKIIAYITIVYIVQAHSVQQAQTEFVSTVSHELRTPLTSIKGFADTILRAGDKLEKGQQRRYVGIIKDQADRLTRLVEDLLAVSGLDSKKLQLTIRAIDLREAIERVLRNLADKAAKHRIVTDLPTGLPPVWADSDRIEQILTNLIDNAVKYSAPGSTVIIAAHEVDKTIEFSVTDQGVGISQEHLPKIFTKFGRLDNPLIRQTEGTGLGLYITRSLVLALGGQIEVSSKPGQTTFTVQLPAASLEEQAARGRG